MNSEYPELYSRNNDPQRVWAERVWKAFITKLKGSNAEERIRAVIDFGCGTGEITACLGEWIHVMNEGFDANE